LPFFAWADPILGDAAVFDSVPPVTGQANFNLLKLGWQVNYALRAALCRLFLLADSVLGRVATPVRMQFSGRNGGSLTAPGLEPSL
jgi:hypothetical protein